MKCKNCNCEITQSDLNFCPECGAELHKENNALKFLKGFSIADYIAVLGFVIGIIGVFLPFCLDFMGESFYPAKLTKNYMGAFVILCIVGIIIVAVKKYIFSFIVSFMVMGICFYDIMRMVGVYESSKPYLGFYALMGGMVIVILSIAFSGKEKLYVFIKRDILWLTGVFVVIAGVTGYASQNYSYRNRIASEQFKKEHGEEFEKTIAERNEFVNSLLGEWCDKDNIVSFYFDKDNCARVSFNDGETVGEQEFEYIYIDGVVDFYLKDGSEKGEPDLSVEIEMGKYGDEAVFTYNGDEITLYKQ